MGHADAVVVPIRIEGAQRSYLSYLKNGEIKRSWFPKVTITILPPVKLSVDPSLKGKTRRNAAGAALRVTRRYSKDIGAVLATAPVLS